MKKYFVSYVLTKTVLIGETCTFGNASIEIEFGEIKTIEHIRAMEKILLEKLTADLDEFDSARATLTILGYAFLE